MLALSASAQNNIVKSLERDVPGQGLHPSGRTHHVADRFYLRAIYRCHRS